jgi:glycosyltransferase involved in cell wall biosynthesis
VKLGVFSNMGGVPWGASEELWSHTALLLQARGHSVAVNYKRWPHCPERLLQIQQNGGQIHWRGRGDKILGNLKRSLKIGGLHRNWLKRTSPDFVLISSAAHLCDMSVALDCLEHSIPYAILLHGLDPSQWIPKKRWESFRRAYAGAAKCFFVSDSIRQLLEKMLAARLPDADVVENPLNLPRDFIAPWPADNSRWNLACVARFDLSSKGQDFILQVLSMEKWRSRNIRVHFWGDDEQHLGHLNALTRMYEVEDKVRFRGFTKDLRQLWATHHAMLLPSRHDGVPMVTVEAMMSGRIPIVTAVGRNAEFVDDNETGFLAAAATVELIDDAMERAWQNRHRWQQMGSLAAERIRERFPADPVTSFADKLEDCACGALAASDSSTLPLTQRAA